MVRVVLWGRHCRQFPPTIGVHPALRGEERVEEDPRHGPWWHDPE